MKVYKIKNGTLSKENINMPDIGDDEVLIKMNAVSLNYRDLLVIEGTEQWKPTDDRIPVSDGAGEIVQIGTSVHNLKAGDNVTTLVVPNWSGGRLSAEKLAKALGGATTDGVLSEYVALKENAVCKFPHYLSFEEASTLPIAALTAWNAVVEQSELMLGDTILILGTGGVSCFALQFSKLSGYKIIITSSSDEKLKKAKSLGAHHLINYRRQENWEEVVLKLTNGLGVDQVVDVVGGRHISRSLKCVRSEGIVSMVGVIDGIKGEVDTGTIMMKAARVQGVETGSTEMYKRMLTAMDLHKMKPVIDKVFSFENTLEAFSYLKKGGHFGKICIRF